VAWIILAALAYLMIIKFNLFFHKQMEI